MTDKVEGYLEVGVNDKNEVIINLDHDRTGHIVFSANQARELAVRLLKWASHADVTELRNAREMWLKEDVADWKPKLGSKAHAACVIRKGYIDKDMVVASPWVGVDFGDGQDVNVPLQSLRPARPAQ